MRKHMNPQQSADQHQRQHEHISMISALPLDQHSPSFPPGEGVNSDDSAAWRYAAHSLLQAL